MTKKKKSNNPEKAKHKRRTGKGSAGNVFQTAAAVRHFGGAITRKGAVTL